MPSNNSELSLEHPTVAAKWRASSFSAISLRSGSETRDKSITQYVEQIASHDLARLLKGVYGQQTGLKLTERQCDRLREFVTLAWDWNEVLKGSVIFLGDFQPVAYANGSPFNPTRMEEFERDKAEKRDPEVAMCTIGLGLTVSRSKVKGDVPEEEVVCRASVVTERRYE